MTENSNHIGTGLPADQILRELTIPGDGDEKSLPTKHKLNILEGLKRKRTPEKVDPRKFGVTEQQLQIVTEKAGELDPKTPEDNLLLKAQQDAEQDEQLTATIQQLQHDLLAIQNFIPQTLDVPTNTAPDINLNLPDILKQRQDALEQQIRLRGDLKDIDFRDEKDALSEAMRLREATMASGMGILNTIFGETDFTGIDWSNKEQVSQLLAQINIDRLTRGRLQKEGEQLKASDTAAYDALKNLAALLGQRNEGALTRIQEHLEAHKPENLEMTEEEVTKLGEITPPTKEAVQNLIMRYNVANVTDPDALALFMDKLGISAEDFTVKGPESLAAQHVFVSELAKNALESLSQEVQAAIKDPRKALRVITPAVLMSLCQNHLKSLDAQMKQAFAEATLQQRLKLQEQTETLHTSTATLERKQRKLENSKRFAELRKLATTSATYEFFFNAAKGRLAEALSKIFSTMSANSQAKLEEAGKVMEQVRQATAPDTAAEITTKKNQLTEALQQVRALQSQLEALGGTSQPSAPNTEPLTTQESDDSEEPVAS